MKSLLRFVLSGAVLLLSVNLFAQTTLWTDDFSDGNYTTNWEWTVAVGSGAVVNEEFVLSPGLPFNDAWASTLGDTTQSGLLGTHYGIYYMARIEGSGTPASTINFRDDGAVYWIVDLYPSNGGLYLLRGEYPAAAEYIAWVTGLSAIQIGQNMKVLVQAMGDSLRVKVWTGPFEPQTWALEYLDTLSMGTLWPGIQVGGWYLDNATVTYDDFEVVTYESVPIEPGDLNPAVADFALHQNYPNPFNPSTTIRFSLPTSEAVHIAVYDLAGRVVKTLASQRYPAGSHTVAWDGTDNSGNTVSSGVYFYRMSAGAFSDAKKLVFMK